MNRTHLIIATFASVMLALSGCVDDDANSVGSDADASVRGANMGAGGTMGAGGADGAGGALARRRRRRPPGRRRGACSCS